MPMVEMEKGADLMQALEGLWSSSLRAVKAYAAPRLNAITINVVRNRPTRNTPSLTATVCSMAATRCCVAVGRKLLPCLLEIINGLRGRGKPPLLVQGLVRKMKNILAISDPTLFWTRAGNSAAGIPDASPRRQTSGLPLIPYQFSNHAIRQMDRLRNAAVAPPARLCGVARLSADRRWRRRAELAASACSRTGEHIRRHPVRPGETAYPAAKCATDPLWAAEKGCIGWRGVAEFHVRHAFRQRIPLRQTGRTQEVLCRASG